MDFEKRYIDGEQREKVYQIEKNYSIEKPPIQTENKPEIAENMQDCEKKSLKEEKLNETKSSKKASKKPKKNVRKSHKTAVESL